MRRRVSLGALCVALALAATAPPAAGQAEGGFDLESALPPGFLDLQDVVLTTGSDGRIIATGHTVLGNAGAQLLLAYDHAAGLRDGLTIGIKPDAWSLTEAIPELSNPVLDQIDFEYVGLVLSGAEVEAESTELSDQEWLFYREIYAADDFRLTLRPGLNLVAAIPAEDLGPDHPLSVLMDAVGIEKGVILIQGGLGRGLGPLGGGGGFDRDDLFLRAELPPVRPPGSPDWFLGGQLAFEVTGQPMLRVVGELTLRIEGDVLLFFVATSLAPSGMALSGGLLAEDGWEQPFGIDWLVLRGLVLSLAITPTGSIQPGFMADMVIGEKDIAIAVAVAINPSGVPTAFMFEGESDTGFGMADLVELQSRMAAARQAAEDAAAGVLGEPVAGPPTLPVDALPDVAFRDVALGFASKDVPELGIERGFRVAGRLWLPLGGEGELTDFAGVDVGVSEEGLWARGDLGAFEIGPLVWQDAMLDLTATREVQHLLVSGAVDLFGASQLIDLALTRESMSFRSETNLFDMFTADISASAAMNLRNPDFQVDAVMHADFGDAVGPIAQDAIATFARESEQIVATLAVASDAAGVAVANAQATVDELRSVLEAQRRIALEAVSAARAAADAARGRMASSWSVRNRALSAYYATPVLPAWRKAQRLNQYRAAHGAYLRAAVTYNARVLALSAAGRVLAAIPPVDQNLLLIGGVAALNELRLRLEEMQRQLEALESQLGAITDALDRGEQLLVIERAEFHGGLQSAMAGEAVRWDIVGSFVGEPFEVHETLDFSNVGEGSAQMLRGLLGG